MNRTLVLVIGVVVLIGFVVACVAFATGSNTSDTVPTVVTADVPIRRTTRTDEPTATPTDTPAPPATHTNTPTPTNTPTLTPRPFIPSATPVPATVTLEPTPEPPPAGGGEGGDGDGSDDREAILPPTDPVPPPMWTISP